jgi:hypothetical protein
MNGVLRVIGRFFKWLFGAPFRALPTEFGNEVPAELQVYEAKTEEAQRERHEEEASEQTGRQR